MESRSRSRVNESRRPIYRSAPEGRPSSPACLLALGLGAILALTTAATPTTRDLKSLGLQAPKEEVEAPDFTLPDLAGKKSRLKDFRGKLVFLNFFATRCVPCRDEMPAMERLHGTYKDKGLVVLAIDIQESAKDVRAFTQELDRVSGGESDMRNSTSEMGGSSCLRLI